MRIQLERRATEGSLRKPLSLNELQQQEHDGHRDQSHNERQPPPKRVKRADFSSNDYLGLALSTAQHDQVQAEYDRVVISNHRSDRSCLGAGGSRLLSGDSLYCRELEEWLAEVHHQPTATLFNSGYDANLSVLSSLLMPGDHVVLDELCHNSLFMGVQMSRLKSFHTFRHNNVDDLSATLLSLQGSYQGRELHESSGSPAATNAVGRSRLLIVVESVYSMDGDVAPLGGILQVAATFGGEVVVDEAHGLGVYGSSNWHDLPRELHRFPIPERVMGTEATASINGRSLQQTIPVGRVEYGGTGVLSAMGLEKHPNLLCAVFTFGKGAGCHGAVVCGSETLRSFLWNYARPFVYSTALPLHTLATIRCAYKSMLSTTNGDDRRRNLFRNVRFFRDRMASVLKRGETSNGVSLWHSETPIQAIVVNSNTVCSAVCAKILETNRIRLFPIRSPTVPKGQERVRIVLHSHNTIDEIHQLCDALICCFVELGLCDKDSYNYTGTGTRTSTRMRADSNLDGRIGGANATGASASASFSASGSIRSRL